MIHKRWLHLLFLAITCLPMMACSRGDEALAAAWNRFKADYLSEDGRIIDTGNGGMSHSEGQGIGMLGAEAAGNRADFERIWAWTQRRLQIRQDHLFAWKWAPTEPGAAVAHLDDNNATDGDILIAWALLRASRRWQQSDYRQAAWHILSDIDRQLVVETPQGYLLLPGERGFVTADEKIVNLSYVVFPAIRDFARVAPEQHWERLYRDSLNILSQARFGPWQLPPDWLGIYDDGRLAPVNNQAFGYDAIRIPLYLIWAGETDSALLSPYVDFWAHQAPYVKSWVSLVDEKSANYLAEPGLVAIMRLVNRVAGDPKGVIEETNRTKNYYSDALQLLTQIAAKERKGS